MKERLLECGVCGKHLSTVNGQVSAPCECGSFFLRSLPPAAPIQWTRDDRAFLKQTHIRPD